MDITEAMLFQHFYWPSIIPAIQNEGINCDTCQRTKQSNKRYGKLTAKLAEETPWNKMCVNLIGPYIIRRKGKNKNLHIKSVTFINPVT